MIDEILTHPGGSHKDEFLACCLLVSTHPVPIVRCEPTTEDLANPKIAVIDVGGEWVPERMNFDHHQFPRDHKPTCALSLVLQHLGIYDDARSFCDWLEPAEWFDTRGPHATGKWLGVNRDTMAKLNSPIDTTLLRRFAKVRRIDYCDSLWQVMRMIGDDLLDYIRTTRERIKFVGEHCELWDFADGAKAIFVPRTDPLPDEPSAGIWRYLSESGRGDGKIVAQVYPDRRGEGYGLSRMNDDRRMEFTRIVDEPDVHFAHAGGFVAKTSASEPDRLQELLKAAWSPESASN
jgi:hypothetical protein